MSEHETEYLAIRHVGAKLGVGSETLRKSRRRAGVDAGQRPRVTSDELAEIKRFRRGNTELRHVDEICEQRQRFSQRNLPAPRRDDPVRGHVQGSFRGRGHLPHPACDRVWVSE